MSSFVDWTSLTNILVVGVLVGAGLPAVFALGVVAFQGDGARNESGSLKPVRAIAGFACFGVVVAAIIVGLSFIAVGGR